MTITLTPDLEKAIAERARQEETTPESVVLDVLREQFGQGSSQRPHRIEPRDDWEARVLRLGTDCGVSLSDEALSSEGLYDE